MHDLVGNSACLDNYFRIEYCITDMVSFISLRMALFPIEGFAGL